MKITTIDAWFDFSLVYFSIYLHRINYLIKYMANFDLMPVEFLKDYVKENTADNCKFL